MEIVIELLGEIFGDLAVELDRGDVRAGCHEAARDGTESGTDLKDGLAWLRVGLVQDLRAELVVHEEILSEALARRDAEAFEKRFEFGFDHGCASSINRAAPGSMMMVSAAATASASALGGRHAVLRHPAGAEFGLRGGGEAGEQAFRAGRAAFGAFGRGRGGRLKQRLELMAALFAFVLENRHKSA